MEGRKEKFIDLVKEVSEDLSVLLLPLFDELLYLEKQLIELKKYPSYKVSKDDKSKQKILPLGKVYRETLVLYRESLKTILGLLKAVEDDVNDPVKEFLELWKQKEGITDEVDNEE